MKWSCFFALFAVANCYSFDDELAPRIVGGSYTTVDQVPYIAQIIDGDDTFCGASIISQYWLVTAAHCFAGSSQEEKKTFKITTGSSVSFSGEKHDIQQIISHPDYAWGDQYNNDIALILLREPIFFNKNQMPIRLATTAPKIGNILTVSGYGWESERRRRKRQYSQRPLKTLNIKIVDQEECVRRYKKLYNVNVPRNSFCATSGRIDSTCSRDSGGPGVVEGKLAGIVSGGYRCQAYYYPNVYTRVYRYLDWIRRITSLPAFTL